MSIISRWKLKLCSFFHFHHFKFHNSLTLMSSKKMCVLSTQWMSMGLSVVLVWTPPTYFHSDKNTWNNCSNILFCVLQKNKSYSGLEQHNNDLVNCSFKRHTWQIKWFLELSAFRESYLKFDSWQYVTWRTNTELAFLTHLSDHVTTPVRARERLSGSVGLYAVRRDRWCVAWWQDGEKAGEIAAYFPLWIKNSPIESLLNECWGGADE